MKSNNKRHLIQALFAAISNGYLVGFAKGKIYTGPTKILCAPGMNCYSCPGAVASCPIGSLQMMFNNRQYKMSLYVIGMLFIFGSILGRGVCAFLCPFGFIQDLLFQIPFVKKIRKIHGERVMRYVRYMILFLFVIILPIGLFDNFGMGTPWFCKIICPVGTLEGGVILVLLNEGLRQAVDVLFEWKIVILLIIILLSIVIYRPFCRYLCPLGAIYGLFNKYAIYRIVVDKDKCTECKACQNTCELDIPVWKKPDSIDCIRCGMCVDACSKGCITLNFFPEKARDKKV